MAEEAARQIGNKTREFFEFVLPPVDMRLDDSGLTVTIDIPGFKKEDIKLTIDGSILSIRAGKDGADAQDGRVWSQRPRTIDKKIRLPVPVEDKSEAKYADGVLTLTFAVPENGRDIPVQ